ncbi:MAG TPA: response regulator transcription factor [Steroidobacteraceae bacterium]|nr:response regulator transcription factor [Steroidobacteraceae bacterium]
MSIRVAVLEDDATLRALYAGLISGAADMRLAWAVGTLAEARAALERTAPDVLLADLGLPDGSGLTLIGATKRHYPACEIMVVSVFGDEENVVAAIEAGATGYLLKDALANWFLNTIRELHAGGSPISPSIARILLGRARRHAADPAGADAPGADMPGADTPGADTPGAARGPGDLAERELQILSLVAKGFNFPEIGQLLSISTNTVKTHVYRIYRKLSVHSRGEAVFEAKKLGLLDF